MGVVGVVLYRIQGSVWCGGRSLRYLGRVKVYLIG